MRVGEVLALSLSDVILDPGREGLLVRDPKNRHERLVILGPDATPRTIRGLRAWRHLNEGKVLPSHTPCFCATGELAFLIVRCSISGAYSARKSGWLSQMVVCVIPFINCAIPEGANWSGWKCGCKRCWVTEIFVQLRAMLNWMTFRCEKYWLASLLGSNVRVIFFLVFFSYYRRSPMGMLAESIVSNPSQVEVYQFYIWLRQISPAIWRRILVRSDCTIYDLHYILQLVLVGTIPIYISSNFTAKLTELVRRGVYRFLTIRKRCICLNSALE